MDGTGAQRGEREFFALAKALGAFKAVQLGGEPSDRALARAARVSPMTVGDWLRGQRFPQEVGKVLTVVRMVRAEAAAQRVAAPEDGAAGLLDEQRWSAAHRDEMLHRAAAVSAAVQRAQAAGLLAGSPAGRLLAEVGDPFALEVHRPIQPDSPQPDLPELPAYIPRDHDEELACAVEAAAAGRSQVVVLVGGSSTGKTRACWEALEPLRGLTPEWRLWHPIDPSRPDAASRELPAIGPRTVVWLNEAQFYLQPSGGLGEQVAAGLRELLRDPARAPVLVLATLWPQFWHALTSRPAQGEDPHAQARELLAAHDLTVPAAFIGPQLQQLRKSGDVRLAEAAEAAQDGQVIQFLAGAPELLALYRNAPAAAKALIHAAMDGRRLGMRPALPEAFLKAATPGYLTDLEWDALDEDWLKQALAYTATPAKGIRGPLTRIRPRPAHPASPTPGHSTGPVYRLADYLDQHGRATRDQIPSSAFWAAAASHADPGDLEALGRAAENRGLLRDAAQLYKQASANGDTAGAISLVRLLGGLHPADLRPARWAATSDPAGVAEMLRDLHERGAAGPAGVLARRAAAGAALDDPAGVARLLGCLREGAADQVGVLLARDPATNAALVNPRKVASLLGALRAAGAADQVGVLLARDPATHAALEDLSGVADLLHALRAAGGADQVGVLLARDPATHAALEDLSGVADLLHALRAAGAADQVGVLARRAAAGAALDDPAGVAYLLHALRKAGASDQVAALLARDPAMHTAVDSALESRLAVTNLQLALELTGAEEQIGVLEARAAAARAAAARAAAAEPPSILGTLKSLREAGAQDQLELFIERLPGAGHFYDFCDQTNGWERYRFGREDDGCPSGPWGWDNLD